jgi:hypothetical protein
MVLRLDKKRKRKQHPISERFQDLLLYSKEKEEKINKINEMTKRLLKL